MPFWLYKFYRKVRAKRGVGLLFLLSLLVLLIIINALLLAYFEKDTWRDDNLEFHDWLWVSVISISTIGYGDIYPKSDAGRLTVVINIIIIGLSVFTVFMGMVVDLVTDQILKGKLGMRKVHTKGHVLLVHFPSAGRVRQLIDELSNDPNHREREIVVITDQIESLPFSVENVRFVSGSPLAVDTYRQANIGEAKMAMVLATSYNDPNSDAVVASVTSVLDKLNPDLHIVAECLDERHRMLFHSVRCDAIVPGLRIAGNLLVQEIHDPGITQMIDVITSNMKGETLFSTRVPEDIRRVHYSDLAKAALDARINLLCVNRGCDSHTVFCDLSAEPGDNLIYLASNRKTWNEFEKII